MTRKALVAVLLGTFVALPSACGGSGDAGGDDAAPEPAPTVQEQQCYGAGWQRLVVRTQGLARLVLWKGPAGAWTRGAIVVLHGGGGAHTNFCVANVALIAPQVRFTEAALARGFAVFLLDSSDQVTDEAGRVCGKVWDDEVRSRANLDLPFIEQVVRQEVPARRPAGSATALFVTGHSSGGFMTVRSATRIGAPITAFAPVSSGDPYGWVRDCTRRPGDRPNVAGVGLDRETGRQIVEVGACDAPAYPNEKPWDAPAAGARPPFRVFHHADDGIVDRTCLEKQRRQLAAHGYAETPPFTLTGGARSADAHSWHDGYNQPLLDWFSTFTP
jgi:hypothetical protein